MTVDEVRSLVAGCIDRLRAAIVVDAGTGLRQGELFGLTVDRIDFLRRTLRVDRQLWSPRDGPPRFAPPKTRNSYRTIALSPLVADTLSAHLAAFGPVTWHDLRHHQASVLLSEGVSLALVAERLGHTMVTLMGTYAHVIRSDEDRVRTIVDKALGGSAEDWLRTGAGNG